MNQAPVSIIWIFKDMVFLGIVFSWLYNTQSFPLKIIYSWNKKCSICNIWKCLFLLYSCTNMKFGLFCLKTHLPKCSFTNIIKNVLPHITSSESEPRVKWQKYSLLLIQQKPLCAQGKQFFARWTIKIFYYSEPLVIGIMQIF